MKAVRFLGLVLAISFLAFVLVSCSSTEKTEPPKPKASIDFEIENLPFSIDYSAWGDVWYCSINIVIYEKAGVGANISVVKSEWFEGSNLIASSTDQGGRVPASGSLKVHVYSEFPARYQPDTYTITISGRDDNGYSFQESHNYNITWDSIVTVSKLVRD